MQTRFAPHPLAFVRESFTVKSNRANEKACGEYVLINEAFRQQRQKGI